MSALLQMSGPVVDLIYRVRALPASGEEAEVEGFMLSPGGGFNAMVAARVAGMAVRCGGSLGTGPLAQIVRAGLERHGIEMPRPADPAHDQGCCTVLVEPSGERTFVASEGAEGHLTAADLAALPLAGCGWMLVSGYTLHYRGAREALAGWLATARELPALVFDPSPLVAGLGAEYLKPALDRAAWISANRREAAHLTGHDDPAESARALARGRAGALVRDGAAGCVLATEQGCRHVPPHPVRPKDTNGAGDSHIGSFIARLDVTGDADHAARYANIAAALSTTVFGPATAPAAAEVERVLAQDA